MSIFNNIKQLFSPSWPNESLRDSNKELNPEKSKVLINIPTGRKSEPPQTSIADVLNSYGNLKVINPQFNREIIPTIRKLCMINPDMSQALQNVINLGNTGHKINFDRNVEDSIVAKMRNHIQNKHKNWAYGTAGATGLVNKMLSQLMIGGALSMEWVVSKDMKTIDSAIFVNPEEIVYVLNKDKTKYLPYQIINPILGFNLSTKENLKPLNTYTYQYYGLNGDGETPYGFPPYMSALRDICTQDKMKDNIDYIVDQLGILGFTTIMVEAPAQGTKEGDTKYQARVEKYLNDVGNSVRGRLKEGSVVGVKDMHEITFQSIGRDFDKVVQLFKNNELQIASALKQDATLWGRDYNTSESQITVIFTKMISELRNVQNIVKTMLEFAYSMELLLQGYQFDYLNVVFDKSTIQDDLKFQQAQEYKIKNLRDLVLMGTISTHQFANEMGYEAPDSEEPRVPWEMLAGGAPPASEENPGNERKGQKNDSDRKTRDKNKPQGTKKPK